MRIHQSSEGNHNRPALNEHGYPPLVLGGQGRSAERVERDANSIVIVFAAGAILGLGLGLVIGAVL